MIATQEIIDEIENVSTLTTRPTKGFSHITLNL